MNTNTISFSSTTTPEGASLLWTKVQFPNGFTYKFSTRTYRTNRKLRAALSKALSRATISDISFYRKSLALLA